MKLPQILPPLFTPPSREDRHTHRRGHGGCRTLGRARACFILCCFRHGILRLHGVVLWWGVRAFALRYVSSCSIPLCVDHFALRSDRSVDANPHAHGGRGIPGSLDPTRRCGATGASRSWSSTLAAKCAAAILRTDRGMTKGSKSATRPSLRHTPSPTTRWGE